MIGPPRGQLKDAAGVGRCESAPIGSALHACFPGLSPLSPARPGGMMGAMARLLGPGVALMNRLRFPQKFAVISLLFALPLGFMMYLWLGEIQERLAFTRKERAGLEYVLVLRHVLEPLDLVPASALLAEGGDAAARGELAQARRQISAGADAVDLADARLGDALGASDVWKMLRPRVTYPAVEPGALIEETLRLAAMSETTRTSSWIPTSTVTT